ncbi:MAG: ribulose-phosphate 3-epimerase [Thermoplasmata archaeon]|jgi:ribulose-phosphate 3-epimerase
MPSSASRNLRLAPSLLSADFADLGNAIRRAEEGGAAGFHLDVMDGHFVPNLSFGPALVSAVRRVTRRPLDIHLMVEHPERFLEAFRRAGGDRLTFHLEAASDPVAVARSIRALGAEAGVALRPETPVARAGPWLSELDAILVMTVNPGFSGQTFLPGGLDKISEARALSDRAGGRVDIGVDGGVTSETGRWAARSGATFFVCGNAAFDGGQIEANLNRLRAAIDQGAEERHALP